jgi:hypothetical protein
MHRLPRVHRTSPQATVFDNAWGPSLDPQVKSQNQNKSILDTVVVRPG